MGSNDKIGKLMFFRHQRKMNLLENECYSLFKKMKNEIKVKDLSRILTLGEEYDRRPYVAQVGFEQLDINAPTIKWYCRSDGNIWAAWQYNPGIDSKYWKDVTIPRDRHEPYQNTLASSKYSLQIPMSNDHKNEVNKFTQELWTMHKLSSYSLL